MPNENQDKADVSNEQPTTTQPQELSDKELQEISGGTVGHKDWIQG